MANWKVIKEQYCTGIPPRELALKHKLTANTISNRASLEEWDKEKQRKCEEIANSFEAETKRIVTKALEKLEELLNKEEVKDTDLISAIGKALDISGLKSQKTENTNLGITEVVINRKPV